MNPWIQVYYPAGGILASALMAAVPLFILFYLLAIRKTAGYKAAAVCLVCALALALLVWRMPPAMAVSSGLMGMAFGMLYIIWVVVTAVWIYNMTVESGEFDKIRRSLASLTNDRRLQAIFIAYAFSSFLEGASGFGTPVAITAAMLAGLGFRPLYAAGICLVANSAPAAFGAIGIPVIVSADVAGLDVLKLSGVVGAHLAGLSFLLPLWICLIMCGLKKSLEVWPALLVAGLSFAVTMYLTACYNGPALPDIVAGLVCLVCLVALLKVWRPRNVWRFEGEDSIQDEPAGPVSYTAGEIIRAWSPYLILTVAVFICGHGGFKSFIAGTVGYFEWPGLHNLILKTAPIVEDQAMYGAVFKFDLLGAGGTAIFVAGLLSSLIMPAYGPGRALACLFRTVFQLRFSILTICLVLALAYIMNYSGMSSTLGLAFTHTGFLFPFFAPIIGWVGVFLTGSDTSANALFSGLQKTTGEAIGVDPYLTVGVNSSGGVTGKMISPQTISIATAATNQVGKEGELFRFALKHSLIMLLIVCLWTMIQAQ
ncbi:lactate permease LctP family transporter [Deltaproteobacteria bacterium OttesenSCG-928-M10]|nr:lactate permease LctP family transporter [Deltaproteobacteria bacterium OttesenSCG-928-M10]